MDICEDKIFNNDPIYMKNLIGKTISIDTVENKNFTGTVYVIDPIYKTIVLKCKSTTESIIVMYHAIKSLTVVSDNIDSEYLEDTNMQQKYNPEETIKRKQQLKKWLTENMLIDVEENGDCLKINDHLFVMPPYAKENCVSNNTLVLEKIINIIDSMPVDFQ